MLVYVLEKLSILEQISFSVLLKARLTQPSKFIHKMSPVLIIYTWNAWFLSVSALHPYYLPLSGIAAVSRESIYIYNLHSIHHNDKANNNNKINKYIAWTEKSKSQWSFDI